MPEGGNPLWKIVDGPFTLPTGEPKALKLPTTHPRLAEVSPFIDNLVNILQETYNDETSEGFRKYSPVISYWKTVQRHVTRIETTEDEALQTMFWPQTDHGIGFKLDYENREATRVDNNECVTLMDELDEELHEENAMQLQSYTGVPSERPKRAFVPLEDISEGRFVVLRPDDVFEAEVPRAVWLGRCMGSIVRDTSDEHHGEFLIEWWRPRHRKSINATNRERYSELLVGQKEWEKDLGYNRPHWINASASIYSWKYRSKNEAPSTTRLNPLAKEAVKCHLEKLAVQYNITSSIAGTARRLRNGFGTRRHATRFGTRLHAMPLNTTTRLAPLKVGGGAVLLLNEVTGPVPMRRLRDASPCDDGWRPVAVRSASGRIPMR
ncbi:hypothetical protein R1sor_017379 [Riccia sorocarpa]|uniref:Uncharacterized protein n=1 Tax=Riccia sorocarpa TaxID=122646 RepID=A0ABD3IAQ5_9MARC